MALAFAAVVAFVVTLLLTPVCRAACRRFGWVDRPGPRKLHQIPVPRAGGIAIFLGYTVATCMRQEWTILPAVLAAFATGMLDDVVNLKPRTKIAGQLLAALLACGAGVVMGGTAVWWHVPVTIIWLVGCTNAVNLIDGLDGVAAGVGICVCGAALVCSFPGGNAALAPITAPLLGALLGFLIYNFSPASIFMGDCGSNTLGFLLGCITIRWAQKGASLTGMAAPVIALAIPILDTALAIVRRFVRREPVFAADRGHIHHRLLSRGFSPRRVAWTLYGAGAFFACLAILLTAGTYSKGPVLAGFGIVIWLALRYLRYVEFDSVGRVLFKGVVREMVSADVAMREVEAAVRRAQSIDECWTAVESNGSRLGLARAAMQVYGRKFAAEFGSPGECWSLRVPLNGIGAMELEVPFGAGSAGVAAFADCLRTAMAPKLESLRPQLAFAAAAGGGSLRRW
jgi:UDP-GlcNAc:undecaprenyl-phosphate/decaprenyl-phosphate GlcNAc-1-phosphate transferase